MVDIKGPKPNDSIAHVANDDTTRLFPPYLLWFVLIPAVPFLFSIASLSFFIDPLAAADEIFIRKLLAIDIGYVEPTVKTLTHISNLLNYLSVTSVHAVVCLFVIGFFLYKIQQLPAALIWRTYSYMAVVTIAFSTVAYIVHLFADNLMLTQLGYKSICILMSMADLQTSLVWLDPDGGHTGEACFRPEPTRLVWLAYTPIMLGVMAVVIASAFTTVMASAPIPSAVESWRPEFLARVKLLQKSFYLLSLVLVTSTITIFQFSSLPLDLLTDQPLKVTLTNFINGITAFWGGMFTATLFATFAPAALLLLRHARDHQRGPAVRSDLGQWLYESVFVSIRKQVMNALVMIAPMLVGPLSHLLQKLAG